MSTWKQARDAAQVQVWYCALCGASVAPREAVCLNGHAAQVWCGPQAEADATRRRFEGRPIPCCDPACLACQDGRVEKCLRRVPQHGPEGWKV